MREVCGRRVRCVRRGLKQGRGGRLRLRPRAPWLARQAAKTRGFATLTKVRPWATQQKSLSGLGSVLSMSFGRLKSVASLKVGVVLQPWRSPPPLTF